MEDRNTSLEQRRRQNIQSFVFFSLFTALILTFIETTLIAIAKHQILFILGLPVAVIILAQYLKPHIFAILKNLRTEWDFLFSSALGIAGSTLLFTLIDQCYAAVPLLYWFVIAVAIVVCQLLITYYISQRRTDQIERRSTKRAKPVPLFMSDEPTDGAVDELGLRDDAINFAKNVENNNANDSLVFGIDAPWGTGKTSYLNFCKKQWEADDCLIFEFSPLRYDRDDLITLFLDSFGEFLLEHHYPRGIRVLFRKYSRKIAQFPKFFNLDFSAILLDGPNDEDLLQALSDQLTLREKKIIVIIDDLDRLPVERIKSFIDIVRVGLKLPSISFVLCFDTKNIQAFEQPLIRSEETTTFDNRSPESGSSDDKYVRKVTRQFLDNTRFADYLEKVVMIKQTLVLNPQRVKDFLLKYLFQPQEDGSAMFSTKSVNEMTAAVEKIFNPKSFHLYADQLGDLRKIKRLINVMRLRFGDLNVSVNQLDFNGYDLLMLMLIYLNSSDVFRKIYLTERDGKEFFSLSYDYDYGKHKSSYVNSDDYENYVKTLSPTERFLVNSVFNERRFKDETNPATMAGGDSAVFNGTMGSGRNLENYLKLIVETRVPEVTNEKKFYVALVKELGTELTMDALSQREEFVFSANNNAEQNFSLLVQAMIRNVDAKDILSKDRTMAIVSWFMDNIARFSVINIEGIGIGLRDGLTLDAAYFLDRRGWSDADGQNYHNTEENVVQAADALLNASGILRNLIAEERGVLGMLDGVKLRLHCSPFRGGDFFNLERGLKKRAEIRGASSGDAHNDVMREVTQAVFAEFKRRYIDTQRCFMSDVLSLSDAEMYAGSLPYVMENNLHNEASIRIRKNSMISFIVYQLVNNLKTQLDFGFGVFDESGISDQGCIQKAIRDYLFSVCFAVSPDDSRGSKMFIDYVLMQYKESVGLFDRMKYKVDIRHVANLLGEDNLRDYWNQHRDLIKERTNPFTGTLDTHAYSIDYQNELPNLFNALDEFSKSGTSHTADPEPSTESD